MGGIIDSQELQIGKACQPEPSKMESRQISVE
jgi:hypothetical protein